MSDQTAIEKIRQAVVLLREAVTEADDVDLSEVAFDCAWELEETVVVVEGNMEVVAGDVKNRLERPRLVSRDRRRAPEPVEPRVARPVGNKPDGPVGS